MDLKNNYIINLKTDDRVIKKSRFITILYPLINIDIDIKLYISNILDIYIKKYPKATHYCSAYVYENDMKSSDDGEPQGSAGLPILTSILNSNIKNCLIIIIRYYGGIKFGKSSLSRTYKSLSNQILQDNILYYKVKSNIYLIEFLYSNLHIIEDRLSTSKILNKEFFDNRATFKVICNSLKIESIKPYILSMEIVGQNYTYEKEI